MVDDSSISVHFSTLQMLRIMSEWINKGVEDLTALRFELNRQIRFSYRYLDLRGDELVRLNEDKAFLDKNWDAVITIVEERQKRLLGRIDCKKEEIQSLQAGV